MGVRVVEYLLVAIAIAAIVHILINIDSEDDLDY